MRLVDEHGELARRGRDLGVRVGVAGVGDRDLGRGAAATLESPRWRQHCGHVAERLDRRDGLDDQEVVGLPAGTIWNRTIRSPRRHWPVCASVSVAAAVTVSPGCTRSVSGVDDDVAGRIVDHGQVIRLDVIAVVAGSSA